MTPTYDMSLPKLTPYGQRLVCLIAVSAAVLTYFWRENREREWTACKRQAEALSRVPTADTTPGLPERPTPLASVGTFPPSRLPVKKGELRQ